MTLGVEPLRSSTRVNGLYVPNASSDDEPFSVRYLTYGEGNRLSPGSVIPSMLLKSSVLPTTHSTHSSLTAVNHIAQRCLASNCNCPSLIVPCCVAVPVKTAPVVGVRGDGVIRVVLFFFLFVPLVYADEGIEIYAWEDKNIDTVFFRFIFLAAVCTMCVLEGIYIANGFGDEQCKNALSSESKIDSPLLLEIGIVGLVVDIIMAVLQSWHFIRLLLGICDERELKFYYCGCKMPCCC